MVVIEHKLPLVMRISDRVVAMDEGEIIAQGRPDEVARNPRVIEAYLGPTRTVADGRGGR
jgi:branched-chain amino acid transport system ATP-binding protein